MRSIVAPWPLVTIERMERRRRNYPLLHCLPHDSADRLQQTLDGRLPRGALAAVPLRAVFNVVDEVREFVGVDRRDLHPAEALQDLAAVRQLVAVGLGGSRCQALVLRRGEVARPDLRERDAA